MVSPNIPLSFNCNLIQNVLNILDCSANSTNVVIGDGYGLVQTHPPTLFRNGSNTMEECAELCFIQFLTSNREINTALIDKSNGSCLCQQSLVLVVSNETSSYSVCIFKDIHEKASLDAYGVYLKGKLKEIESA